MKVSIIIVNYHVKKELLACIASIYTSKPQATFEVIVVDNDERKTIEKDLKKQFPKVVYIANENKGFGQGNNIGANQAKGEYFFFLNPDTIVHPEAIDHLVGFLQKKKDVGIVAPLLLGKDGKPYQQGTQKLTPLRAFFSLSFIHKMFPKNKVARDYLLLDWDRKSVKEVDVAPGTAFMIRKDLFEKIHFDEHFFLFFEEFDLCKRIRQAGYNIFITPQAKVAHVWGVSTQQRDDIAAIFQKSRFYYFKKHFGFLKALLTEAILRFNKYIAMLMGFLAVGIFLRLDSIQQSMPFIGDQAWYYISARDMISTGKIPLVGIESSHPWLHQGALWTYLLALSFKLLGFNPFVGMYLSIVFGVLGMIGMYGLGKLMFSRRVGIIAAALFATSPLVILSDRMPYHTSPIPFFTILFIYFLYKWVKGNYRYLPLVIASLGILYNFEIATLLLGIVFIVLLFLKNFTNIFARKNDEAIQSKTRLLRFARNDVKILVLSLVAFVITMLPMLIYDIGHGFPQTAKMLAWMGYRVLLLFGYPVLHPSIQPSMQQMLQFTFERLGLLLFPYSGWVALVAFIGATVFSIKYKVVSIRLLLFLNFILIVGFLAGKTASGAYLPMMFPAILLLIAVGLASVWRKVKIIGVIVVIGVICVNSYYSFETNRKNHSFEQRMEVAKSIVKQANGKEYNLKGRVSGKELENFGLNYAYLTWWLGHGPSQEKQKLQFVVVEENNQIKVEKKIEN